MKRITLDISKYKTRKGVNSESADIVFSLIEKYNIDVKTLWGKRFMGAMLRETKKSKSLMRKKIGYVHETLELMRKSKDQEWKKVRKDILSDDDKKIKWLWNKLLK